MDFKRIIFTAFLFIIVQFGFAQDSLKAKTELDQIWDNYDLFHEATIQNRFIKHADVVQLIQKHVN